MGAPLKELPPPRSEDSERPKSGPGIMKDNTLFKLAHGIKAHTKVIIFYPISVVVIGAIYTP